MRKGLFTLVALVITISAVLGLGLTANAGIEDYLSHVVVYDGNTWTEKADIAQAVADGEADFVGGKFNVEDIDVVAIVDDDETSYDVYTDTIVAIAVKSGINVTVTNTDSNIQLVTTKTVEFNGDEFTANVYVNTENVKAAVGKTFYKNVNAAVADAVAANGTIEVVDDLKANPVVVFGTADVTVSTSTAVAVVAYNDADVLTSGNFFNYEVTATYENEEYTAYAIVNTSKYVAVVGRTLYTSLNAAIEAVEVDNFDNIAETPVVVIGTGVFNNVVVSEMVVLGVYDYENTTLNFNTADVITYEKFVDYEGDEYKAYAVVNTNTFPAIVVDADTGDFEFVTDLDEAIKDISASTIDGATEKAVVVLKSGVVEVAPEAKKMAAVAVYNSGRTTLDFGGAYTYETTVEVSTDFLEGEVTVYAVVNAAAVVVDVDVNNKDYSYKFYTSVDAAIAAADGNLTKAVVVLANGTVNPTVNDFVFLATVDNRATFNKAGYFTFDANVEYAGFDITGIAVYNTDYIFGGTAESINEAFPSVNATYTGTAFNIALSTDNVLHLASAKEYADILVHFAPLFVLGDEAYINGYQVYAGRQVSVDDIIKAIRSCIPTLGEIENLEDQTIFSVDVRIGSAGTYVEFPVNVELSVSEENFNKIKDTAALVNKHFDLDTVDGKVIFAIDAKPVVDIIFEKELTKGKTVKEVRDLINSTSINDLADKVAGYNLTGKKAKVADLFVKAVNKVAESQYASYLDLTLGMLDMDETGVYSAAGSYTVDFGTKFETAVNKFNAKFPTLAKYVSIDAFASIQKVTFAFDGTIAVFDVYTVTFVDVNGNVIFTADLLEGEIPVFEGDLPTKEADGEYIYEFAGWTDGTTEFAGELAPLTKDTTYAPYFTEIALEQIDENLKFEFGTVSFADSFKLNMFINKSVTTSYDKVWVVAVMADGEERTLEYVVNGDYFQFIVDDIAAKEVVDVITFTIYAEASYDVETTISVKGETKEYGVKTYAFSRLEKSEDDKFKTLCVDALIYAAEAQKTFDYKVETLATDGLTAEQLAYATTTTPVLEDRFSLDQTGEEAVRIHQAALELETNVRIKVYFKLGDYAADEVYVLVNSVKGEFIYTGEQLEENGVYYTISFSEYAAKELREDITVEVYDLDGNKLSATLVYGAEAYACRQIANEKNVDLCNAIMNYSVSAKAYFLG